MCCIMYFSRLGQVGSSSLQAGHSSSWCTPPHTPHLPSCCTTPVPGLPGPARAAQCCLWTFSQCSFLQSSEQQLTQIRASPRISVLFESGDPCIVVSPKAPLAMKQFLPPIFLFHFVLKKKKKILFSTAGQGRVQLKILVVFTTKA